MDRSARFLLIRHPTSLCLRNRFEADVLIARMRAIFGGCQKRRRSADWHSYTPGIRSCSHELFMIAEDAVGAIIAIQSSPEIDLVLSDVVMPRMNGSELVSKIRKLKPNVKVVLMFGYTARPDCQSPNIAPGVPFLQKPFTPRGLAAMVRGTLDAPLPNPARKRRASDDGSPESIGA